MNYKIHFSCISHVGNYRRMNQDNFICAGQYMEMNQDNVESSLHGSILINVPTVFGIFDGMGGEECGEVASYIAAKNAAKFVWSRNTVSDLSGYCRRTNDEICGYVKEHLISSMGTTAALLAFTKKEIVLCNIGDSKIFRFSDGVLEQISKDHVVISAFGVKPPLYQNLGIPPTELEIEPYMARGKYHNGDIYLICSDGLTDMVTREEIEVVLFSSAFDDVTLTLLDKALVNGGRDNISMIACKIERKSEWIFR